MFQSSAPDDDNKLDNKSWKKDQKLKRQARKEGKALSGAMKKKKASRGKKGTWAAVGAKKDGDGSDTEE